MAQMDFQERVMLGQLGQRDRRGRMGDRVLAQALAPRPVYSTGGALAQGLSGALAGALMNMDDRDEEAAQKRAIERAGEFEQQRQQRYQDQLSLALNGATLPAGEGQQGPTLPAPRGEGRIDALAGLAGNNPLAATMLQVEMRREDAARQERLARETRAHAAALAGRESFSAPTTVMRDGQEVLVQVGNRGTIRPMEGFQPAGNVDNLTPGRAQGVLVRLADGYAAGTLTPAQEREFESAMTIVQTPRTFYDQQTGTMTQVAGQLPPFAEQAVTTRRQRQTGQTPAAPAPVAQPAVPALPPSEAIAPPSPRAAPTGAVPIGNSGMSASPPGLAMPAGDAVAAYDGAPGVRVQQVAPGRGPTPPAGFRWGADGASLEPIPGGPQDHRTQALTEAEAKANLFGTQMKMGNDIIGNLRTPNSATIFAWQNLPETAVNMALSPGDQQYFNAVRLFAAGVLRKETGAAFTANELRDVHSRFFPIPGDDPATIRQKAQAREQAISSIRAEVRGGIRGELPRDNEGARRVPAPPPGFRIVQ